MSDTVELTKTLIAQASVTPDDKDCQRLLCERLQKLGFTIETLRFGEVDNFWARIGTRDPVLCFAGHTDVVPSGPVEQWKHDPFTPTVDGDLLYGRGSADMKGSIAAMVTAVERFAADLGQSDLDKKLKGSLAFLITSDEEGPSIDGTVKVVEHLEARNEKITWCLVGEPSSSNKLGDVIKNGRRGSITGHLSVQGQQGHVAYPHLATNPFHVASTALAALVNQQWDNGNDYFPPTTFQISNIHAGTGADNVIPGELSVVFNLRYSTETDADTIKSTVHAIFDNAGIDYSIRWRHSGKPFLTPAGHLTEAISASVEAVTGYAPELSTAGGTSDGRFIAPTGAQVVELGPINASIHKIDEHVSCSDLDKLSSIYQNILTRLLT